MQTIPWPTNFLPFYNVGLKDVQETTVIVHLSLTVLQGQLQYCILVHDNFPRRIKEELLPYSTLYKKKREHAQRTVITV